MAGESAFGVEDVTCGCGCWTLEAFDAWLGLTVTTDDEEEDHEAAAAPGPPPRCADGKCQRHVTPDGPDSEMDLCARCWNYVCVRCGRTPTNGALVVCGQCGGW